MTSVGTRIKRLRERKGFTQEYMAHVLDMSQSNYHKIESDKTDKIDFKMILKIADLLETDLATFLPTGLHVENNHNNQNGPNGILIQSGSNQDELIKAKEEIIRLQADKIAWLELEVAALKARMNG